MLDIAQRQVLALQPVQQVLQPRLPLAERQRPQILAVGEEQIEAEEDQGVGLALRKGGLQGAEIRHAALVERHGLAVDHAVRQALGLQGDGGEFLRPIQPLARAQRRLAVADAQLQAIAVELDLVRPAGAAGRLLDQLGELRLDEFRYRRDLAGLGLGGRDRGLVATVHLVALPHRAGRAFLAGHEGRWRRPRAERDLLQGPSRGDRLGVLQKLVLIAFLGRLVAMLDQQPVGALAAPTPLVAVPFHPHEHPAAMQALAFEDELEVALLQSLVRVALRQPVAAVPELHRAAAILAFGNGALEVAVVERMVLDLDRQPLDRRIERRTLGHRPRLEGAVELQPEIVVQARGVMALHHEAQRLAGGDGRLAGRLLGLAEVALGAIGGETVLALFAHGLTAVGSPVSPDPRLYASWRRQ